MFHVLRSGLSSSDFQAALAVADDTIGKRVSSVPRQEVSQQLSNYPKEEQEVDWLHTKQGKKGVTASS